MVYGCCQPQHKSSIILFCLSFVVWPGLLPFYGLSCLWDIHIHYKNRCGHRIGLAKGMRWREREKCICLYKTLLSLLVHGSSSVSLRTTLPHMAIVNELLFGKNLCSPLAEKWQLVRACMTKPLKIPVFVTLSWTYSNWNCGFRHFSATAYMIVEAKNCTTKHTNRQHESGLIEYWEQITQTETWITLWASSSCSKD